MRKVLIFVLVILAQMESQAPLGELNPIDQRLDDEEPMLGSDLQGRDPGVPVDAPLEEKMEEVDESSEYLNDGPVPANQSLPFYQSP